MKNFLTLKNIFWLFATLVFVFMFIGSFDAGVSGDEYAHYRQSVRVYNYYTTFGEDSTAITDFMGTYGQFTDNLAYFITRIFHTSSDTGIMNTRHATNAVMGWLCILFAALATFRIANKNWLPAIITFLLFAFSPRFIGHSFNNLKDLPLATFMMMGIYYTIVFLQDFPKVKWSTIAMLIVSIGFAIAVRIGGLLLVGYIGLFGLVHFLFVQDGGMFGKKKKGISYHKMYFKKFFLYGIIAIIGGYLLALLLWPYALQHPIDNITASFKEASKFSIQIRQLFEGSVVFSSDLPRYYISKFMFMTIPFAVLLGFVLSIIMGFSKRRSFWIFVLLFGTIFPVFWIAYTNANVYGGWRHALFAYPPMVALAGLGYNYLIEVTTKRALKYVFIVLPFVLLIHPAIHIFKNHPYEYVYFNEFTGGIKNMYGNYELDYYSHGQREAVEWILENVDTGTLAKGEKIKVASWITEPNLWIITKDTVHFQQVFSRYDRRGENDWDYAVFPVMGGSLTRGLILNKKFFPPSNTIYKVKVDDVPICFVLKRNDRNDYYGYQAMRAGLLDSAIYYYCLALQADQYNESALNHLSEMYLQRGMNDSALVLASRWAEGVPDNLSALSLLANIYLQKRDPNNAMAVATRMKKVAPREMQGYWISAYAYLNAGQAQFALNDLKKVIELRPDFKQAYLLMAQIYQQSGDNQTAQQLQMYASQLP
jgi:Tfp pilus assembly protein PilF